MEPGNATDMASNASVLAHMSGSLTLREGSKLEHPWHGVESTLKEDQYHHVTYTDDVHSDVYNHTHVLLSTGGDIAIPTGRILVASLLGVIIIATIFGNSLVLLSVAFFRKMRTPTHLLIASLATADFMVALLVLPISLYHELVGVWNLGPIVCDLWLTLDIFCCTASMWNVCIIALDRYWKITKDVGYTHAKTFARPKVCIIMVITAWTMSAVISTAPLFGWYTGVEKQNPMLCMVSQDIGYTIFSTMGAFYIPSVAIIVVYVRIYKFAIKRLQERAKVKKRDRKKFAKLYASNTTRFVDNSNETSAIESTYVTEGIMTNGTNMRPLKARSNDRLRRSTTMLGAIIGCFEICWLPFFLIALITPLCPRCHVPNIIYSIVLWLGYLNSLLNPVIYAVWNKEFRGAFKQITRCNLK
ncbi:5-hydroxytryptamine receptor 1A-like [Lingula anatina]|uniref:5-hydroxytryptamine receptor 1A-like n=1 Tax=Lingula anatina TaxID=7574 RepID=A0A1S3IHJ3_LINAN|nr:5-hydroxytryptamine receptor 1A-like [Lingula anatina]XP_013397588.1 5-hydroxytryptamine receptor 1A-like [Lingula anatina]XP_013397589.1 5-hydroxytryptamine receptor 1A-like [Lingula anatina]XP_013397590.1 5-hydroxytryptamine receptor 1A-like [Lingula anatina]XP_013397591.1 5-hydroxytryptamine receptor 1A-like [Lingula anatina]XP_013397592.1 5-hydroxytryptamine receptor 1A-like [Lingula anatina]XP_013397593.1 5-hydroxytryptamine receptor 1A-like [Lingula anatina]XP_013397594.1 5-hydroxyt|eukprot:XP_013397587.1 5-hydroxytryptamine receptor 1A-like [Lingula anatina]